MHAAGPGPRSAQGFDLNFICLAGGLFSHYFFLIISLKVETKTVILANKEQKVQVARFGDLEWEGACILAIIRYEQIQISQLFCRVRFSGLGKGGGGRQTSVIPPQESAPIGRGN